MNQIPLGIGIVRIAALGGDLQGITHQWGRLGINDAVANHSFGSSAVEKR